MNQMAHLWHCSAAQLTAWDEKGDQFEFHRKEASKTFKAVGKMVLPWYKTFYKPDEVPLVELWRRFKEQEKDPVYSAYLKKERQRLLDMAKDVDTGLSSDEMDVIRKEQERLLNKRRKKNNG